MEAEKKHFVDGLFKGNIQYVIPCYQRQYKWTAKKHEILWNDIEVLIDDARNLDEHLMGAIILYDNKETGESDGIKKYWVVDGQQRLTTIYVMLKALYDIAKEKGFGKIVDELSGFLFNKVTSSSLDLKLKIRSKNEDEPELNAVFSENADKTASKSLIHKAYDWYKSSINKSIKTKKITYDDILVAIKKLILIEEIFFEPDGEDPQVIFEHVNYNIEKLDLFDKVRNLLLTGEKYKNAEMDYKTYWKPLENLFTKTFADKKDVKLQENEYMRTFLNYIGIVNKNDDTMYEDFRNILNKKIIEGENISQNLASQSIINTFKNSSSEIQLPGDGDEDDSTPADSVRLWYLQQLLDYSHFYILFVNKNYDQLNLEFGSPVLDYSHLKLQQFTYSYSWEIRVLLYWFRFLDYSAPYTLFFKLFKLEKNGKISQNTLKKILLLILDFSIRYFIVNKKNFMERNEMGYNALWDRIFKDNNGKKLQDEDINDSNCYKLFANWFERPTDPSYTIYPDGDVIESLTDYSTWITNTKVILFIFLLIYYKQIIFNQHDNLLTFNLVAFTIFPQESPDELKNSIWKDLIGETQMEYLFNHRAGAIGNLGVVDNDILKIDGVSVNHKNGVLSFCLDGGDGDFINKKDVLDASKLKDLYLLILNTQIWNKVLIEKQTEYLANQLVKYLQHDDIGEK